MENEKMAAAAVFAYLVAGIDADEMGTADEILHGYALQHVGVNVEKFGAVPFARACLSALQDNGDGLAVEVLADYFDVPSIAILAEDGAECGDCGGSGVKTVDSGAIPWATDFIMIDCPTCNNSGFNGYGSGYDAVCSDCGGQSAYSGGECYDLEAAALAFADLIDAGDKADGAEAEAHEKRVAAFVEENSKKFGKQEFTQACTLLGALRMIEQGDGAA